MATMTASSASPIAHSRTKTYGCQRSTGITKPSAPKISNKATAAASPSGIPAHAASIGAGAAAFCLLKTSILLNPANKNAPAKRICTIQSRVFISLPASLQFAENPGSRIMNLGRSKSKGTETIKIA
jgi:hypothetical protein